MAMLVVADRVSVVGGADVILDDVSFGVATGDRVGVVGRNGAGKSTLLRVLRGDQRLQAGRTAWVGGAGGRSVLMLEQADTLDPADSVHTAVLGTMDEHEWASHSRVRDILGGLLGGLDAAGVGGLATPVGSLSGGQRRRVALAAALVADPDLLLLDEPTNHLDLEAIAWLAQHLTGRRSSSATVTVTHDRWFLDATSTSTWEIVQGQVRPFEGGYAAYVLAKAERERVEAVTAARRDNLLRKELAWLRRGAPARTSKPRFRLEEAAALIADEPPPRDSVALARFATSRLGKDVLELVDADVGFDGRPVLTGVTWRLAPGERVGIVGANGAGKSTVVRALLGQVGLTAGRRRAGRTVVAAYLSQELVELVPLADRQVIEAVTDVRSVTRLGDKEVTASQLATRLGFVGPRQQTRVGDLSGGERRRLQLLRLLMTEPNVLVLDEPTNDLDIEMLTALEDLLDGWPGTLVVISHDRYLIERVTDHQVGLLGDGRVRDLPGGVDEYLARRVEQANRSTGPGTGPRGASGGEGPAGGSAEPSRAEQVRQARKDLARIERRLAALEAQEAGVHAEMAEHAVDHQRVARLHRQAQELAAERAGLEEQWLVVAELLP